jgi:hypothetical protein
MLQRQAAEQLQSLTNALDRHVTHTIQIYAIPYTLYLDRYAHADRSLRVRCHLRLAEWLVKLNEMEDYESGDGSRVLERTNSAHRFISTVSIVYGV